MHITFDELSPPVTKWGWTMRNVGRSWASIGSKVQVIGIVSPAWTVIGQASGLERDSGTFGQGFGADLRLVGLHRLQHDGRDVLRGRRGGCSPDRPIKSEE